jgi:hypothetical protein
VREGVCTPDPRAWPAVCSVHRAVGRAGARGTLVVGVPCA